jgi:hypothetical protein
MLVSLAAVVIAAFAGVSTGSMPWPPTESAFEAGEHEVGHRDGAGYEDEQEDDEDEEDD